MLLADDNVLVERLVTTVDSERRASTVHGIPVELLAAQARSIGLPLQTIAMCGPGLDGYVEVMNEATVAMRRDGIEAFAFGDLSSSNVLGHKVEQFAPLGIEVVEPLWDFTSAECIETFLSSGIRAVTIVVDADVLDVDHVGVALDRAFVDRLPQDADQCGELGEYHSFVYDGPLFQSAVDFSLSAPEHLERDIRTTEGRRRFTYWLTRPCAREAYPADSSLLAQDRGSERPFT